MPDYHTQGTYVVTRSLPIALGAKLVILLGYTGLNASYLLFSPMAFTAGKAISGSKLNGLTRRLPRRPTNLTRVRFFADDPLVVSSSLRLAGDDSDWLIAVLTIVVLARDIGPICFASDLHSLVSHDHVNYASQQKNKAVP